MKGSMSAAMAPPYVSKYVNSNPFMIGPDQENDLTTRQELAGGASTPIDLRLTPRPLMTQSGTSADCEALRSARRAGPLIRKRPRARPASSSHRSEPRQTLPELLEADG